MARPLRLSYDGAVYHVTARGNAQGDIFLSERDRERYLYSLEESIVRYDARLYLFCLMTNHVHLVLETPRGNLSALMQRLHTAYTVWFNRKHNRSGHLFQGRYSASVVDEDAYILKLSRYVHLNPVFIAEHEKKPRSARVKVLRDYAWSSYPSYIGLEDRLSFVSYAPVLRMMGRSRKKQISTYRRFVEGGISHIDTAFIEDKQASRLCIGSVDSRERVILQYERQAQDCAHVEDIYFQRSEPGYRTEAVLSVLCAVFDLSLKDLLARRRNSWLRAFACRSLHIYCRLSQREIGQVLGIGSGVAVGKQIRQLTEAIKCDKELRSIGEQVDKRILKL
ncbi:transposase [Planctomycetota bacterium]